MANGDGEDAARLAAAVTRLERRVEELAVAITRQEAKLDHLIALATPDVPDGKQNLSDLIGQLVNVTVDSNTLLKRLEQQLERKIAGERPWT